MTIPTLTTKKPLNNLAQLAIILIPVLVLAVCTVMGAMFDRLDRMPTPREKTLTIVVDIVAFVLGVLGIVYAAKRLRRTSYVCPTCGSRSLRVATTPVQGESGGQILECDDCGTVWLTPRTAGILLMLAVGAIFSLISLMGIGAMISEGRYFASLGFGGVVGLAVWGLRGGLGLLKNKSRQSTILVQGRPTPMPPTSAS